MVTRTRADKTAPLATQSHPAGDPVDAHHYAKACAAIAQGARRYRRLAAKAGAVTLVAKLEEVIGEARTLGAATEFSVTDRPSSSPSSRLDFAVDHLLVARRLLPEAQENARQAIEMALYLLATTASVHDMA